MKSSTVSSTYHGAADGATHMTIQVTVFTLGIFTTCCNTLNWKTALYVSKTPISVQNTQTLKERPSHSKAAAKKKHNLFTKWFPCVPRQNYWQTLRRYTALFKQHLSTNHWTQVKYVVLFVNRRPENKIRWPQIRKRRSLKPVYHEMLAFSFFFFPKMSKMWLKKKRSHLCQFHHFLLLCFYLLTWLSWETWSMTKKKKKKTGSSEQLNS